MFTRQDPSTRTRLQRLSEAARSEAASHGSVVLPAIFLLLLAPLWLVVSFRALGEGCLRLGGASFSLGAWFLVNGLMHAVPGPVGRWVLAVWLALVVAFVISVASGPVPVTCPAWQH